MNGRSAAVSTASAVLIILLVVSAGVGAYGWLRPGGTTITTTVGAGSTATVTQTRTETATQLASIEDLARREGTVTIYGIITQTDWTGIIQPAFLQAYPWAKVDYLGLTGQDISTRSISEFKANKVTADVTIPGISQGIPAIQAGAIQQWNITAFLKQLGYGSDDYDPAGYWFPGYHTPVVLLYNTNLVKDKSTLPKSWADMANPIWKGKLVMQNPTALGGVAGQLVSLFPSMGNETWTKYVKTLKDNSIVVSSNSEAYTYIATGQAQIGFGQSNDYFVGSKKGDPVGAVWLPPATSSGIIFDITKGAPHPNMAKLLIQWLVSPAGQLAISKTGRVPWNPAIQAQVFGGLIPPDAVIKLSYIFMPDFVTNPTRWGQIFRSFGF